MNFFKTLTRGDSAIGLESVILKSGYLTKLAKVSQSNWKLRYFVLNGNSLTYYKDHKSTASAKGDLLLTADSHVEEVNDDISHPFTINIVTPFCNFKLSGKNEQERREWIAALRLSISRCASTLRDYMDKKGSSLNSWQRKFFILHADYITFHEDHLHTSHIQGIIHVNVDTLVTADPTGAILSIQQADAPSSLIQLKAADAKVTNWLKCLSELIAGKKRSGATSSVIPNGMADLKQTAIRKGCMNLRPVKGGEQWPVRYFVLTSTKFLILDDEAAPSPLEMFTIHPNCSIFETNLRVHSFELVTSTKVIHVQAANGADAADWIGAVRGVIATSRPPTDDPLLVAALEKSRHDEFYEITFHTKKPLGIVLERSGEWAIVKLSNFEETRVSLGSSLASVNGESVMLKPYMDTIRMLTGWKPPLVLSFRKAPEKRGWLTKQARARHRNIKNWKPRYFILGEGKLSYYDSEQQGAVVKGELQLMGSAVCLVPHREVGQYFCFKLVSGLTSLIMQGLTMDVMVDWASSLYHAIAIANGGTYLLEVERRRLAAIAANAASHARSNETAVAGSAAVSPTAASKPSMLSIFPSMSAAVTDDSKTQSIPESQPVTALLPASGDGDTNNSTSKAPYSLGYYENEGGVAGQDEGGSDDEDNDDDAEDGEEKSPTAQNVPAATPAGSSSPPSSSSSNGNNQATETIKETAETEASDEVEVHTAANAQSIQQAVVAAVVVEDPIEASDDQPVQDELYDALHLEESDVAASLQAAEDEQRQRDFETAEFQRNIEFEQQEELRHKQLEEEERLRIAAELDQQTRLDEEHLLLRQREFAEAERKRLAQLEDEENRRRQEFEEVQEKLRQDAFVAEETRKVELAKTKRNSPVNTISPAVLIAGISSITVGTDSSASNLPIIPSIVVSSPGSTKPSPPRARSMAVKRSAQPAAIFEGNKPSQGSALSRSNLKSIGGASAAKQTDSNSATPQTNDNWSNSSGKWARSSSIVSGEKPAQRPSDAVSKRSSLQIGHVRQATMDDDDELNVGTRSKYALGPLSDVELERAFSSLDTSNKRTLNSMQFSSMLRMITGQQNLYLEMKMFNRFDADKSGKIDPADFVGGFKGLEQEFGVDNSYICGLRKLMSGDSAIL